MSKMPNGFPLEPSDSDGNTIKQGDVVKILHIPEWLIHNLDEDSKKASMDCEGTNMKIYEIDEYGYLWVEKVTIETDEGYESNSFSMEPKNVLLQINT